MNSDFEKEMLTYLARLTEEEKDAIISALREFSAGRSEDLSGLLKAALKAPE